MHLGFASFVLLLHLAAQAVFIVRALLRPQREPAARLAWVVVIIVFPILGILAYVMFGETNLGRRRIARLRAATRSAPTRASAGPMHPRRSSARSASGRATRDSDAAIAAMIADIDAATDHVHICFYIWLPDGNGLKMVEAVKRAARRGVTVRAMADDLGSRLLIRSPHWDMEEDAGVRLVRTLAIGFILLRPLRGRIDMRNHRKIVVVDNRVTYCGSQNCADPAFAIKAKYAPWVDLMMRFEGPIVRQNQHLFASDWMAHTRGSLAAGGRAPVGDVGPGFVAQVIGTSAAIRSTGMPEIFESLMYAARHELVVTTLLRAGRADPGRALRLGPARGRDDADRAQAQRQLDRRRRQPQLLPRAAGGGVRLYEYRPGLLHTKSLTLDGEATLAARPTSTGAASSSTSRTTSSSSIRRDRRGPRPPGAVPRRQRPGRDRRRRGPGACASSCATTPSPCSVR